VSDTTIVIGIAVAYLVACLVVGMWPGRSSSASAEGYVAGDRSLGLLVMYFITGATVFSAFAFLGMPGWAYSKGVAALYVLAYGAIGFVPFYDLGPRASRLGKRFGFVTQGEMVARRFRMPAIAAVMAIISAIAFIPYLAVQMRGAGMVLETMTGGALRLEWGAAIVYGIVLIYVQKSGVLGVGWTNTFQGVFMMILAWVMGLYLPHALYGGVREMFERVAVERPEMLQPPGLTSAGDPWSWTGYASAVVVSVVGFAVWPHLFMKAFSARDERTLRRTVVLYPTFQFFLIPILLIGFAGILFEPAPLHADQILPHLLMNLELSPYAVGFFCAGALAASMSSGDAIVHACASILVRDGIVTAAGRKLEPQAERRWIRILLVVVMVASYAVAVTYGDSIVALLLYAYGPIVQFAPAIYATLYWKRATGAGVLLGMLTGIAVKLTLVVWPQLRPIAIHAGMYGLAVNAVVLITVSLLTSRSGGEHDEEFLAVAAGR
jgi:SSS family solute:Na+ symporter